MMNQIDVNKAQIQSLGSSVQLKRQLYGNSVHFQPEKPTVVEDTEISLFRSLVSEMAKNGKYEEAIKMLVDTIEEMQKDIKELQQK